MYEPIGVLLISGSVRQPSYTRTLTSTLDEILTRLGAQTIHWSLCDDPLPIADPEFHTCPSGHFDQTVRRFVDSADSCDAFVLASPIHHNSFSGVLKNALDHLAIPQFRYKPVALLSHGGNRSTQAVDQLRIVARGLYAVAIPAQVCTSKQDFMETAQGYGLISEDIMERLVRLAGELMLFGNVLRELRIPACAIQ